MASSSEEVIAAVEALVRRALPGVDVKRDAPWPSRVRGGGLVIVRSGDPGEAEECFSPQAFTWRHEIPLEVFASELAPDRFKALEVMLTALSAVHEADRGLGGLCAWSELTNPPRDDVASEDTTPIRAAIPVLIAEYTTTRRLG